MKKATFGHLNINKLRYKFRTLLGLITDFTLISHETFSMNKIGTKQRNIIEMIEISNIPNVRFDS